MIRRVFEGGTYSEVMPDGRWIVQTGPFDMIQTSWGPVPPLSYGSGKGGLITGRLDPVIGSHRICGHEQEGFDVILYELDEWHNIAFTHSGGDSSAFGPTGKMYWNPNWDEIYTIEGLYMAGQNLVAGGIRQITNINGIDVPQVVAYTYADPARQIWAYTTLGDIVIGQGGHPDVGGGVIILFEGKRYVLDTGFAWYIRANKFGDRLGIAYWKRDEHKSVTVQMMVDEIRLLPEEPPYVEPLPEPDVEPFERELPHFAYYTLAADKYKDYYDETMHACWCATESDVDKANAHNFLVIAGPNLIRRAKNPVMVMIANDYQGAPPLEVQIDQALPICDDLHIGLLVVDDANWKGYPNNLPKGAILLVKAYLEPDEAPDDLLERMTEILTRNQTHGNRSGVILGCDDRLNTLSEREIIEGERIMIETFAELAAIQFVGVFSYGRANATTGGGVIHPTAWAWAKASFNASTVPIDWTRFRLTPMEKPEITVSVDNNWPGMTPDGCKNGQMVEIYDRVNFPNKEQKIRILIRDGGIYFEIQNEKGTGATGRFRPVKLG